jgi:hypothetical protein
MRNQLGFQCIPQPASHGPSFKLTAAGACSRIQSGMGRFEGARPPTCGQEPHACPNVEGHGASRVPTRPSPRLLPHVSHFCWKKKRLAFLLENHLSFHRSQHVCEFFFLLYIVYTSTVVFETFKIRGFKILNLDNSYVRPGPASGPEWPVTGTALLRADPTVIIESSRT